MKRQFIVTHSIGQAGYEEDGVDSETVVADDARSALELCIRPEHRDWPVEVRDSNFATASNPGVSERYSDSYIAERLEPAGIL